MYMTGCFGLIEGYRGVRFPADRLVESHVRLDAVALYHAGALLDGTETTVRVAENHSQLAYHASNLLIDGTPVGILWDVWARPWFACPKCSKRRQHVYLPELVCRTCL